MFRQFWEDSTRHRRLGQIATQLVEPAMEIWRHLAVTRGDCWCYRTVEIGTKQVVRAGEGYCCWLAGGCCCCCCCCGCWLLVVGCWLVGCWLVGCWFLLVVGCWLVGCWFLFVVVLLLLTLFSLLGVVASYLPEFSAFLTKTSMAGRCRQWSVLCHNFPPTSRTFSAASRGQEGRKVT